MPQLPADELMSLIVLLEERAGYKSTYRILEPFQVNSLDIIDIQRAAKLLAEFAGLGQLVFIVSTRRQEENVGAKIDLQLGQQEVFIDLSEETASFPAAVLATLAHEIAHKFLHLNNINVGTGPSHSANNEVLTDVAAVFLGYGKLLLNGLECTRTFPDGTLGGRRFIERTLKTGYLGSESIAFAYLLACAMRNIPQEVYERNLNAAAGQAVRMIRVRFSSYWDPTLHHPDSQDALAHQFQAETQVVQRQLLSLSMKHASIHQATSEPTEAFIVATHAHLHHDEVEFNQTIGRGAPDPCLRYLGSLKLRASLQRHRANVARLASEAHRLDKALTMVNTVVEDLCPPFVQRSLGSPSHIRCWTCGNGIQVPSADSSPDVECPNCHYRFVWALVPATPAPPPLSHVDRSRKGFARWLKSIVNRS